MKQLLSAQQGFLFKKHTGDMKTLLLVFSCSSANVRACFYYFKKVRENLVLLCKSCLNVKKWPTLGYLRFYGNYSCRGEEIPSYQFAIAIVGHNFASFANSTNS